MKKSIAIGIITGIVMFLLVISCGKRMQTSNKETEKADVAKKNKTEGYFYHQAEQDTKADSSRIRKNINN
ncbi:hypothetical protein SAMN04487996_103339 [Dyadobacter soli]|uniref:Uncharacterized protein n=1 Tax=Dyadobacter soli TaxID=659014 RepID=A0A1G7A4U2_9BACT|nr:hypothetical protein [Dyadobacter soli]SDE09859.1 hypothetical protein SAMN04487996_103339 [Dyadobacter soli]